MFSMLEASYSTLMFLHTDGRTTKKCIISVGFALLLLRVSLELLSHLNWESLEYMCSLRWKKKQTSTCTLQVLGVDGMILWDNNVYRLPYGSIQRKLKDEL